jgi:MYXO-CTERM domain-containing protein
MSRIQLFLACGSIFALTFAFHTEPAQACGGLFCSASAPVNQAAERIIFSKNADGTVTAVVQIQYQGPSEEFAWVLPVPGVPDVQVSSDLAFTRLQQASNPQYNLTTQIEGNCMDQNFPSASGAGGSFGGGGGAGGAGGGSVTVLAEGNVGPYDYVVIFPEASFDEVGDVAVEWLLGEGYDVVPPGGDPATVSTMLGSYLQGDMNLIAFRLTKGNDEGTIRPIRITYETDQPMIPIRPTAVAANDDMGVMVWVLGESRAVPVNYRSLELNEVLIDWLNSASNYNAVVIEAANQAGGQGFVTERAGPSANYDGVIVLPFERQEWDRLVRDAPALTSEEVAIRSLRFSAWDGFEDVLEDFLPPLDVQALLECPGCGQPLTPFDVPSFIAALEATVIEPMFDTEELVASLPYATRLYTTLSAPEMDVDPLFDFNPDLDDVTNVHNAARFIECGPTISISEAPSRVELEDGRVVRLNPGEPWPFDVGADDAPPANAVVAQLSTKGPGTIVTDNRGAIDAALDQHNDEVPGPPGPPSLNGGGGCAVGPMETAPVGLAALGLLAGALVWRRRGRQGA